MRLVASDNKPVALWAVPRSISTAFERVFVERDDFEVLHEPFSASYYYGEDRLSDRFADAEPKAEYSYERVAEDVFRPREQRVFLKDMAYHAKKVLSPRVRLAVRQHLHREGPEVRIDVAVQDVAGLHAGGDRLRGSVQAVPVRDGRGGGRGRRRRHDLLGEPCRGARRLLRAPRGAFHGRLPHVGVEGGQEVGQLGGMARGCRGEHRHKAGRAQGPRAARGARGGLRVLFALLLRAGRARHPIRGAAVGT